MNEALALEFRENNTSSQFQACQPQQQETGIATRSSASKSDGNNSKFISQEVSLPRRHPALTTNVTCPSCRKIYTKRSLDFHLKICTLRKAEEEKRKKEIEKIMERQNKAPARPPGQFCYICGRRCTKSSWEWHESKCQEQWYAWNDRLPKELRHRGGILKPDISEEAISCVLEEEKADGKANFTRIDAIDKICIETSCMNALPV